MDNIQYKIETLMNDREGFKYNDFFERVRKIKSRQKEREK